MKISRLLSLLLALALLLGVCPLAFAESVEDENPLLATVDGKEVRYSDVSVLFNYLIEYYGGEGYDMTGAENLAVVRAWSMEDALQTILINRYAAEHGLDVFTQEEEQELRETTDTQWEEMLDSYIEYYANNPDDISDEELQQLRENGAAYYGSIGFPYDYNLQLNRQSIINERVQAEVCKDVTVSDAEIQAEYEARVAESEDFAGDAMYYELYTYYFGYDLYIMPEGYRAVKQILLPADEALMAEYTRLSALWEEQAVEDAEAATPTDLSADAVTYEQVEAARAAVLEAARETVDEIMAQLEAGTSFDQLMAIYGTDPLMADEPTATRGIYVHPDSLMWSPALIEAAFSVENPGDVAAPVVDSEGIHIVLYVDDVPGGPVPLDDTLRATLYESLLAAKETETFQSEVARWIAEADVQYTEAGEAWNPGILDQYTEAESEEAEAE